MAWVGHNALCRAADRFPISAISRIGVLNTKILYPELSWILTGIFALIGEPPAATDEIGFDVPSS